MINKKKNRYNWLWILFLLVSICMGYLLTNVQAENIDIKTPNLQLTTHEEISIESDQDFIDLGFSGDGTELNPYLIENLEIKVSGIVDAILIKNTTKYFTIQNCVISGGQIGIALEDIESGTAKIINNNCSKNALYGISLVNVSDVTIEGSTTNNNGNTGIRIRDCTNLVINGTLCDSPYGTGILAFDSINLDITENNISSCLMNGITFQNVTDATIHRNIVEGAWYNAVEFNPSSSENKVHHNDFIDNHLGEDSQGYDLNGNNLWYDEGLQKGNYWSNYDGEGTYRIDGSDVYDLYPLLERVFKDDDGEDGEEGDNGTTDESYFALLSSIISILSLVIIYYRFRKRI
ncbi:MAG: right-handed parallel beta-helix repeat-containing protein [Asgard group archaeon]|nr:right-handed parallel beta-helix repeat-containing protein [Asgard group archaeon]